MRSGNVQRSATVLLAISEHKELGGLWRRRGSGLFCDYIDIMISIMRGYAFRHISCLWDALTASVSSYGQMHAVAMFSLHRRHDEGVGALSSTTEYSSRYLTTQQKELYGYSDQHRRRQVWKAEGALLQRSCTY